MHNKEQDKEVSLSVRARELLHYYTKTTQQHVHSMELHACMYQRMTEWECE